MRFVVTMKADNRGTSVPPDPKLMAEIGRFSDEMTRAGHVVATGGLAPASTLLKASNGALHTIDGPFPETKELIAGWVVLQVKSKEEAIELSSRFMKIHQDILGPSWTGEAEIRQVFGPDDFAPPK